LTNTSYSECFDAVTVFLTLETVGYGVWIEIVYADGMWWDSSGDRVGIWRRQWSWDGDNIHPHVTL